MAGPLGGARRFRRCHADLVAPERGGARHEEDPVPRIVASEFLSPDGVMEDLGGSEGAAVGGWTFRRPNAGGLAFTLDDFRAHEALLLGRITDEVFAAAWPGRTDEI